MHDIKPEFGNRNQIALLQRAEKRREMLLFGLPINVTYDESENGDDEEFNAYIDFMCVCGKYVQFEFYVVGKNIEDLEGSEGFCACGKDYSCVIEDHQLKVKLL